MLYFNIKHLDHSGKLQDPNTEIQDKKQLFKSQISATLSTIYQLFGAP